MTDNTIDITDGVSAALNLAGNLVVLLVQKGVITAQEAVQLKAAAAGGQPGVMKALDQVIKVSTQ